MTGMLKKPLTAKFDFKIFASGARDACCEPMPALHVRVFAKIDGRWLMAIYCLQMQRGSQLPR
jgi:hypothetical protein